MPSNVFGRTPVKIESRYANGWLEYKLTVTRDPFFSFLDVTTFFLRQGENILEIGPDPSGWVHTSDPEGINWSMPLCTNVMPCQQRPYQASFRIRCEPYLKKATYGCLILMSLGFAGDYHSRYGSGNAGGYANMDCLLPCPPEEAEPGLDYTMATLLAGLPDPEIESLLHTRGQITGVNFLYDEPSTMLLQGSHDLSRWKDIAYIYGSPGLTSWTTNTPLNNHGTFFRLQLMAEGHVLDLPPIESGPSSQLVASPSPSSPRNRVPMECKQTSGGIEAILKTTPGKRYEVCLHNEQFARLASRVVKADSNSTKILFGGLPEARSLFVAATPLD